MKPQPSSVLIVDDNEDIRSLLTSQIQRQGHTMKIAENGRQGLELVRSQPFDLMLLDILLLNILPQPIAERLKQG